MVDWNRKDSKALENLLIYRCDTDGYGDLYYIDFRDMGEKAYKPLSLEKTQDILCVLSGLIGNGYKFKEIKRLIVGG